MDLLTQAHNSLKNIAKIDEEFKANKAVFEANRKAIKKSVKTATPKTTQLKDQEISLTWGEMVKFNISTTSFPHVDNYTHMIKRVVKNVTQEGDTLKGLVKMGGQTLVVTKDANYIDDSWDIQGVL
jgi:hypothetical protein